MNTLPTLLILVDAGRWDYINPDDMPFLWSLKNKGIYAKKLYNPGGYCERSVFMTGASPEVTDNYFAMALIPPGYKRPDWEPTFNVPPVIRDRLCMTEDAQPDFEYHSFRNWTEGRTIESFWDKLTDNGKSFAVEACIALGIRSYNGRTTHGTRPIQLASQFKYKLDLYYIQYSEVDQELHYLGTTPEARRGVLRNADASIEWLVGEFKKQTGSDNVIIFGDHGMDDIKERVDIPLEYPPFKLGWDYLYLKSSAAVQFWTFNKKVDEHILNDPLLKKYGDFVPSPTPRQADYIWQAKDNLLLSPCHFHGRGDPLRAMHGWNPQMDSMKGFAIVVNGKDKGVIDEVDLRDICPTVSELTGIKPPHFNEGVCITTQLQNKVTK